MTKEQVLDFWFKESTPEQWFKRDAAFDDLIVARFKSLHDQALSSELDHWAKSPLGAVALVIVLDQFSRNMFRDSPRAFASDAKALQISQSAVAAGLDCNLTASAMQKFLYMPFMHSEDLKVQDEGLKLFEKLNDPYTTKFAISHREEIERFGRFPGRNAALGRISTPEEIDYLRK
jgi:uncharacterized protein (DUF924 family)